MLLIRVRYDIVCCHTDGDITLDADEHNIVRVYVKPEGLIPVCWERQNTTTSIANTVCKQLGLNGAKNTSSVRYATYAHTHHAHASGTASAFHASTYDLKHMHADVHSYTMWLDSYEHVQLNFHHAGIHIISRVRS